MPSNDFETELRELMTFDPKRPQSHYYVFLRNHAEAILALVGAAKVTIRAEALDHNDTLWQALAALNKE